MIYLRSTPLGSKDIRIGKLEFVAKTYKVELLNFLFGINSTFKNSTLGVDTFSELVFFNYLHSNSGFTDL